MTRERLTNEQPKAGELPASLAAPSVSITIVNHRSRDLLRACLESLRVFPYTLGPMEIVVLDNASDDGSVEMLRDEYPEVVVLAERIRRGYAANQNRAVAASHGSVVFVLNPDATVHDRTIDRLVAALSSEDGVTIAGGPIANDDGSLRQNRPHPFPTPLSPYISALGLRRLRSRGPMSEGVIRDGWPSGAAFLIYREVFDDVGGFDESYFMYSEDADLFLRLVGRGEFVAWVPDAIVTHPFRDEPVEMAARRESEIVNAELQYLHKHFGGTSMYRIGIVIDSLVRLSVLSVPGVSRLIKQHGKPRAHLRQVRRARLAAAIPGNRRPRLGDLAREWNEQNPRTLAGTADGADARDTESIESHDPGLGVGGKPRAIRDLIVFGSNTDWDGPRMGLQHIAIHVARRAPVLFVDPPKSPVRSYRQHGKPEWHSRLRRLDENIYRLTPVAPPGLTRPGINRLTPLAVRRSVAKAVTQLDADVKAFFCSMSHGSVFDAADADIRVYHASDDFQAGAELMGRSVARIRMLDEELAARSDVIVASSPAIANLYKARGYNPILVPNGVETEAFAAVDEAPLPNDVRLDAPIAGHIGHISERIDFGLVEAVADCGISVLLVGTLQKTFGQHARLSRLLGRPNVQWVGPKPFAELPSYLRMIDVGLVPYTNSAFNMASFPLKTLEYLAAGRPVVATNLPAITWLDTDLIATADEPDDFAGRATEQTATSRSPDLMEQRRAFAATHSWSKRVEQLAEVLGIVTE